MPRLLDGLDLLETMTNITTSIKQFASLNRAQGPTWTDATKRKAPHKPLLPPLLAHIALIRSIFLVKKDSRSRLEISITPV